MVKEISRYISKWTDEREESLNKTNIRNFEAYQQCSTNYKFTVEQ
jgi:hypothetical protein